MSVSDRYVEIHPDGWAVRCEGTKKASSVHYTFDEAFIAGRSAVMHSGGGKLHILDESDQLLRTYIVGPTNDPFHSRRRQSPAADGASAGESAASADSGRTASRSAAEILSMICGPILKAMPWRGGRDQSKPDSVPDGSDRKVETLGNRRYVVRHPDGWAVKADRKRASSVHLTQDEAIIFASSYLSNTCGGDLVVHGSADTIQDTFTVPSGNDPFPPRG